MSSREIATIGSRLIGIVVGIDALSALVNIVMTDASPPASIWATIILRLGLAGLLLFGGRAIGEILVRGTAPGEASAMPQPAGRIFGIAMSILGVYVCVHAIPALISSLTNRSHLFQIPGSDGEIGAAVKLSLGVVLVFGGPTMGSVFENALTRQERPPARPEV